MQSIKIIKKINKYTNSALIISLIFLIINSFRFDKQNILLNLSNIFLISSVLMIICIKFCIFHIKVLKLLCNECIHITDSLIFGIEITTFKICIGVFLAFINFIFITVQNWYESSLLIDKEVVLNLTALLNKLCFVLQIWYIIPYLMITTLLIIIIITYMTYHVKTLKHAMENI